MIIAVIILILILVISGCSVIKERGDAGDFILSAILGVALWLGISFLSTFFFEEKVSTYDYYKVSNSQYLRVETYHYNNYVFGDKNMKIKSEQHQEISKINKFQYTTKSIY